MFAEKTRIHLWDLLIIIILCRTQALHATLTNPEHFFHDLMRIFVDCFTYTASLKTEVCKSFYEIYTAEKPTPLLIKLYPGFIGKSSFSIETEIYNAKNKELYVRHITVFVTVDKKTRKSTPLPDWFIDKYASVLSGTKLTLPKLVQPQSDLIANYSTSVKIVYSDIDSLGHANFTTYIKYAMQAAMEASANGKFHGLFKVPHMDYIAKNITVSYLGECKVGDVLAINAWQNLENKQKCYVDISRNGKSINQITMEFYENELLSRM